MHFESLYNLNGEYHQLSKDWLNLSDALYEQIKTLNTAKAKSGLAKLTVGLAAFGSIGLAMLKQKGAEPVKVSAPIHTPFGVIPSVAETVQILCKKFVPQN